MALLSKNGVLASIGGALSRFVAACIDACCGKWYCHLPDYTCDQNEPGHISEHTTRDDCLRQCGDRVEHYCHGDYKCDTDPTDALASYPSKWACEENCSKDYAWYCVYTSADYTKGSSCQQGKGPDEGLVRSGPYKDKPACDAECESLYYCVLLNGFDGSQPEHYACVIDPAGHLVISGPTSQTLCEASCSTRRRTIWCVDNKRCVISYDGPPPECSFGVFCEEHPTYQECVQICHPEKWYCVTPGQPCQQMANPPTPDAIAYSTQAACDDSCDDYYCCWVSTDPTKGSYCQLGRCPPGLERSGPHQDKRACEGECHKMSCWSYNDITTGYKTLKVCQEESPDGCRQLNSCENQLYANTLAEGVQQKAWIESLGFQADMPVQGIGEFPELFTVKYRCILDLCNGLSCTGSPLPIECIHENVTKESGPYGTLAQCEPICNPPTYKWYCENRQCKKCCSSGNCVAGDASCPAGVTLYDSLAACSVSCVKSDPPCYFCNSSFPNNIQTTPLPNDVCLDQGGFIDLAIAQGACGPLPTAKCCAGCDMPLVNGACPPGFTFFPQTGSCIKAIEYNCDPQVLAQIVADYPECQSGFQVNNGPCPQLSNWEWVTCDAGRAICQEAPQGPFISKGDCESFNQENCNPLP